MYQEFLPNLIDGFIIRLRADKSWQGQFDEEEVEILLEAMRRYLGHRCVIHQCDLEDEQTKITMTLRVFDHMGKPLR